MENTSTELTGTEILRDVCISRAPSPAGERRGCCSTVEGEGEIPRAGNVTPASQRLSASQAPLRNATASESQPRRMHVHKIALISGSP